MNEEKDESDIAEQLVQEVLREFPPEEQGKREEWNQHVGWHRREDVHAPLRGNLRKRQSLSSGYAAVSLASPESVVSSRAAEINSPLIPKMIGWIPVFQTW
eukprot:CAMPEP_0113310514 /NCGR_PEP_ID=MMETSP0010_2-20120614/8132_1 /TAXON_ID=216773 ORGANISM="Corethron hystrix, Strain 308" /NCGR_SAMPLE_ID=MMETSP0010_2 /ASSEMBLY_ACC=CAM_ASM_000155 /LENGTH=100 /DNA_ID=CAMNT_0000165991 /DNA_START=159 /DNA_END=458 /DNA_ORIENTATION=+ /assembly_acc=CAM_ASM_000155